MIPDINTSFLFLATLALFWNVKEELSGHELNQTKDNILLGFCICMALYNPGLSLLLRLVGIFLACVLYGVLTGYPKSPAWLWLGLLIINPYRLVVFFGILAGIVLTSAMIKRITKTGFFYPSTLTFLAFLLSSLF